MIPKIIHFCWLSNDPYPKEIRQCMDSWEKVMPDYEIKLWNMETFDVSSAPVYVQEAVKARKWAFAADYIRMYALYTEGGIYLVNPGSPSRPRSSSGPTAALFEEDRLSLLSLLDLTILSSLAFSFS